MESSEQQPRLLVIYALINVPSYLSTRRPPRPPPHKTLYTTSTTSTTIISRKDTHSHHPRPTHTSTYSTPSSHTLPFTTVPLPESVHPQRHRASSRLYSLRTKVRERALLDAVLMSLSDRPWSSFRPVGSKLPSHLAVAPRPATRCSFHHLGSYRRQGDTCLVLVSARRPSPGAHQLPRRYPANHPGLSPFGDADTTSPRS